MSVYLSAGVYPKEMDFSDYVRTLNTSNVGMVAITERGIEGAVGANTAINSWDEFVVKCGSFMKESYGAYAAKLFFDNGGGRLFVSRVVHYDSSGNITSRRAKATVKSDETTPVDLYEVEAISTGAWGNNLKVKIIKNDRVYKDGHDLEVYLKEAGVYQLKERFTNLTLDETSKDFAVAKVVSNFIRLVDAPTLATGKTVAGGELELSGGTDDITSITDQDYIKAIKAFADAPISTMFIPGNTEETVIRAALDFCEQRKDVVAIFETEQGIDVNNALLFREASGNPYDSSYGALYYPWLIMRDPRNGLKKAVPPTGAIAGIFNRGQVWEAPAGVNRGIIRGVESVERILDQGDRDRLYERGINPIAQFLDVGAVVWGQKTLQIKPTALDRINVRRLMNYIEKSIEVIAKTMVFESSNKSTWAMFARRVVPFLQALKDKGALYDFLFVCDETTNTPERIDRNEMNARIFLKPVKSAEFIGIEFILTPTGAEFSEFAVAA